MPSIEFERPLVLLLLPPILVAVYWLWRTGRAYMPPVRRRVSLGLRMAVMTGLVLVVAGPLMQLRAQDLAVAMLLDHSDSITPQGRADEEKWLAGALAAKAPQDRVAVVSFGQDATVERALSTNDQPPRLAPEANGEGSRTDIAAAIRAGVAALPPSAARRIVLLTDGLENLDHADPAAALAAAAGVQIDTVPLTQATGPEVLVRQLDAPQRIREGESFSVTAQIDSTDPTQGTLHLLVDGNLVSSQQVTLNGGTNRFVLPLEPQKTGNHVIRVQIEADNDTMPQNNAAGALTVVTGPANVLVVEGTPGEGQYLADALRASGLNVDVGSPVSSQLDLTTLRNYAGVVLTNVPADALAAGQMQALKTYVQSYGGGLTVIGGDNSYGPGSYSRTPLEDMLPVSMDLRGKSASASVALMLVIDTSGSMGEGPPGATKMDLAKEAAISAAELLGDYDQIGVIAFEEDPRWVIHLTSAGDIGTIQSAIGEMQPGGGTEIYPALKLAYDSLANVDAKVKHIILLTDGEAPRGDYPGLARDMNAANITLSTIGIGSDADTALLQELADLGKGRYYDGNDPFDLPRLVVKETQQVQRAAIVEQDTQAIKGPGASPTLDGIDVNQMPQLRGYVATTPKPQSSILLVSRQLDPLLTEWQYGLGRVMAFTSDARNKWASRWLEWSDFSKFWGQVVRRTLRPAEDPNRQLSVQLDGNQAQITLDAETGVETADRQYLNFLPTTATVIDPKGQQQDVQLPQVAPGRYQASLPVQDDGVYLVQASQPDGNGGTATESGGFVVPYSPEYKAGGVNQSLLDNLSKRTGGQTIHDPSEAFVHDLPAVGAPRPLWPWLLAMTALLLVMDVGARRVRVTGPEVRGAYYAVRRRLGYVDEPQERTRLTPRPAPLAPTPSLVGGSPKPGAAPVAKVVRPAAAEATRPSRLLAAKQRASRR